MSEIDAPQCGYCQGSGCMPRCNDDLTLSYEPCDICGGSGLDD